LVIQAGAVIGNTILKKRPLHDRLSINKDLRRLSLKKSALQGLSGRCPKLDTGF